MSLGAGPFLLLPIAARDFFRIVRGSLAFPVAGKVQLSVSVVDDCNCARQAM
jgi:hypothetical protein